MEPQGRFEVLLPLAVGLCLLGSVVIISPHQPMWLDEVYTYYSFAHDSFGAFVQSYWTGVNTLPPLYFFASWPVFQVIPLSPLSLRLLSSLGCGVAVFFIWKTLRRHTGFFAASAATLTACLTSDLFLAHNAEARYYGIYLALIAWATYNYDRMCADVQPSAKLLVLNAVSHALAVSCTYVAGLYSLAILLSLLTRDLALRFWRPKVYLSVVLGWLPVLFLLPMIWDLRGRGSWMKAPGLSALYDVFRPGYHVYFVLCAFAGLVAIAVLRATLTPGNGPSRNRAITGKTLHLIILAFAFMAVPYGMLLISWAVAPLLLDRYALPSLIGIALLAGVVCADVFGRLSTPSQHAETGRGEVAWVAERLLCALLLGVLLTYPLARAISIARPSDNAEQRSGSDSAIRNEMVLATSDPHSYYPRYFQSGESRRIYYVVRDAQRRQRFQRFNARLNPVAIDDFLAAHHRFQIISEDAQREWLEAELQSRGNFRISTEWRFGNRKLLTVERN